MKRERGSVSVDDTSCFFCQNPAPTRIVTIINTHNQKILHSLCDFDSIRDRECFYQFHEHYYICFGCGSFQMGTVPSDGDILCNSCLTPGVKRRFHDNDESIEDELVEKSKK